MLEIRYILVRSGSADPYHCLTDSDPALSSVTFKMPTKNYFLVFFGLLLFEDTFISFFNDKTSLRSHKTVEMKDFITLFAV